MFFVTIGNAQIGVTVTNNTNTTPALAASYTSLATALNDLNAVTAMTGPVTLTLAAGNETAVATGFTLGNATLNSVLSATNTITIIGAGATTVINAGVGTASPSSAVPDGIFKLVGADYVTIDGITFTDFNTTNPATMEFGLAMFKASDTDGCQNNIVQNCNFNMQRINFGAAIIPMVDGSVGVLLINALPTAATTAVTVTAATGSNSNNLIYTNTINGGNYGIVLSGFAAPSPFTLGDTGNNIGGSSLATGNTILNFGGGTLASNPCAGIRSINQWDFNLSYNTINNNNGSGVNHPNALRGISTSGSTSASGNINRNVITISGGGSTSEVAGISNYAGGTSATNTININNNTVVLNYSTATDAIISGVLSFSSATTVNINNNSISAGSTIPGTGTHILISGGSPVNLNINGNTIQNYQRSTATTGILRGISMSSPTNASVSNNSINNLGYTNASSTGSLEGIVFFATGTVIISSNELYDFRTAGGNMRGIIESASPANKIVSGNLIYNFANTSGYTGTGITMTGIRVQAGNVEISKNKVYDITSSGTAAVALGINITGSTDGLVVNNLIGNLFTPTAIGLNAVRGIDISGGSNATKIYNNSVRLNATSTSATTFGSSCLFFSSAPTSMDVRNNIFVNTSTPAQESANVATNGIAAGIRRSGGANATVPVNYATTSNNNLIWVNPTAGTNNHAAYAEGTATVTNLQNTVANLKTFMANRDQLSVEENLTFVSTTGSDATFLHIDTATPTFAESGGTNITTVTTDFDNDIRQGQPGYTGSGSYSDIGADEFNGVSAPPSCTGTPTASTTTAPSSICSGVSFGLSLGTAYSSTGISYQWQSSTDGTTYTNVATGGTNATYTASQTAATFYQCVITCTNGGASVTSTPVQVTMNAVVNCFCPASVSSTFETEIGNVTFGTLNNGTATPILNNTTAVNTYTSFTNLPATDVAQGAATTFSLSQITSGSTFYPAYANVFIDYNGNGVFDLPAERALSEGPTVATPLNNLITGTITIPVTSVSGNVLMRVVLLEGGNNTTPACNPLATGITYGEVEDYVINITPCIAPAITTQPTTTVSLCENGALSLSVSATGSGLSYLWKKDGTDIATATSATFTIPSVTTTNSGVYTVVVTGACGNITSSDATVTVTANTSNPAEVVSVCDAYTWAANGTTYTTSGTYTNVVNCVASTLNLTITSASTPTGTSTQVLTGGVAADVTIEDIVVSGAGIVWYSTLADATTGTNPIVAGALLTDNTTYYAVSVNGTCRSSALAVTVTVVLGNASFNINELSCYPNPVIEIFNIRYNKNITDIKIFDLSGRLVKSVKTNAEMVEINIKDLSAAMYIVKLQAEDNEQTEIKIFKK